MLEAPIRSVAVLACLALLGSGCSMVHGHARHLESDVRRVQVISALVGGKNVFIPSTIAVAPGTPTVLSLYNTTGTPHGFSIPALGIEEVVPVTEEFAIELPPLEGPRLLTVRCQLHPAHRTATLLVMPAGSHQK